MLESRPARSILAGDLGVYLYQVPSKNAVKEYESGGYYHLYNRGVEKRQIFMDQMDYSVFVSYLDTYLSFPDLQGVSSQEKVPPSKVLKNYFGEIKLLAYCLMPNHFHLMVKQESERGIDHFMRSLSTKYVRYFNTKHKRVGSLFQDTYKGVRVENEYQFIYLSKYIHRNPIDLFTCEDTPRRLEDYKYSSYGNYLNNYRQVWLDTEEILGLFGKVVGQISHKNYREFVEESSDYDHSFIKDVVLDIDS